IRDRPSMPRSYDSTANNAKSDFFRPHDTLLEGILSTGIISYSALSIFLRKKKRYEASTYLKPQLVMSKDAFFPFSKRKPKRIKSTKGRRGAYNPAGPTPPLKGTGPA
ncbi:MAG: hypothetical protein N3B12_09020, partial [Armatimonadetes bacterium]|nr:hypothetical protein [Armatimonadota bacterium]